MVLHPFLSRSKKEKERKKEKREEGMLWVGFGFGPNSTWAFPIVHLYLYWTFSRLTMTLWARLQIWGVNMGPRLRKHQKFRMIACSLWSRIASGSMANTTGLPNFVITYGTQEIYTKIFENEWFILIYWFFFFLTIQNFTIFFLRYL